jgi:2-deoxy-D-gluconate 3-dehydrogenase
MGGIQIDLGGRVAVVTGGGTGLGRGAAQALADAGAAVVVMGRRGDVLQTAATEIGAEAQVCDVADAASVDAAFTAVAERLGRIDILVNAAGVNRRADALDFSEADWDLVVDVNAKGTFLCSQAAGRRMRAQGYGKIVNIGSLASEFGIARVPAYCASKGAVRQLTMSLAVEWARFGIRVNCIEPGWFRTDLNDALFRNEQWLASIVPRIPLGRTGTPADLGGTVLFLASALSDYVTGVMIPVDGGVLAG